MSGRGTTLSGFSGAGSELGLDAGASRDGVTGADRAPEELGTRAVELDEVAGCVRPDAVASVAADRKVGIVLLGFVLGGGVGTAGRAAFWG